jgi:thiamine-phosphate pyrophosphorylase
MGGSRVTSRLSEVYAIVDAELSGEPIALARRAVAAGCPMLQLRAKHLDDRSSIELALELRALCKGIGAAFVMNDRADIARVVGADWLHLGQSDLRIGDARKVVGDMRIGVSTHDFEQATEAEREGADLIAFGPVFETKTKQNPDPVVGVQRLAELCRSVSRPVVAIGGITPENAGETLEAGARYVAVVSALPKFLEGR